MKQNKNIEVDEYEPLLTTMIDNSLKHYKNEVLMNKMQNIYNNMMQNLSHSKLNTIETATKKIIKKENVADYLSVMLNYLGLERLIRCFVDLQNHIYHSLRKEGISDQMLIDTLYSLTGEDVFMSLAMKNELNNAFYKMHLLTNEDMQARQKEQKISNLFTVSLN